MDSTSNSTLKLSLSDSEGAAVTSDLSDWTQSPGYGRKQEVGCARFEAADSPCSPSSRIGCFVCPAHSPALQSRTKTGCHRRSGSSCQTFSSSCLPPPPPPLLHPPPPRSETALQGWGGWSQINRFVDGSNRPRGKNSPGSLLLWLLLLLLLLSSDEERPSVSATWNRFLKELRPKNVQGWEELHCWKPPLQVLISTESHLGAAVRPAARRFTRVWGRICREQTQRWSWRFCH